MGDFRTFERNLEQNCERNLEKNFEKIFERNIERDGIRRCFDPKACIQDAIRKDADLQDKQAVEKMYKTIAMPCIGGAAYEQSLAYKKQIADKMQSKYYEKRNSSLSFIISGLYDVVRVLLSSMVFLRHFSCEDNVVTFELGYYVGRDCSKKTKENFFQAVSELQNFLLFDVVGGAIQQDDCVWQRFHGVLDMKPDTLLILKGIADSMVDTGADIRLVGVEKEWLKCRLFFADKKYANADAVKKVFTAVTGLQLKWDGGKELFIERKKRPHAQINSSLKFLAHGVKQRTPDAEIVNSVICMSVLQGYADCANFTL